MNKNFLLLPLVLFILSCTTKESEKEVDTIETTEFFGKESVCIDLINKSCGYKISILTTPDAYIWHFNKDSLNYYVAVHAIPEEVQKELNTAIAKDSTIRHLRSDYTIEQI